MLPLHTIFLYLRKNYVPIVIDARHDDGDRKEHHGGSDRKGLEHHKDHENKHLNHEHHDGESRHHQKQQTKHNNAHHEVRDKPHHGEHQKLRNHHQLRNHDEERHQSKHGKQQHQVRHGGHEQARHHHEDTRHHRRTGPFIRDGRVCYLICEGKRVFGTQLKECSLKCLLSVSRPFEWRIRQWFDLYWRI